ncbi:MAG: L,D-transpeptidase [Synechococcaceae cyanobacterium]|jgi:L,D-transpeptidase ErfK/SrfK
MRPSGFQPTGFRALPLVGVLSWPLSSPVSTILVAPIAPASAAVAALQPPIPARERLGTPGPGAGTTDQPAAGSSVGAIPAPEPSLQLVLDRQARLLRVLENGQERRRFSVAVGMPGWETPVGEFQVLEKTRNPVWEHPQTGRLQPAGPDNPLGSRWIGFHRDCNGRKGWDGDQVLDVKGCVVAGFHGTPHRWTVGRAVSHGCVRLYDEEVRELFELVSIGTPVTVLP